MSYEKVELDLNQKVKKAVIGGGLVLAGFLAGKSEPTVTMEEIDGKKAQVVHIDGYGNAAVATLASTLALSAGVFSKENRKKIVNTFNRYCGRD